MEADGESAGARALRGRIPVLACGNLLQHQGFTTVSEIAGGLAAWEAAGLPLVRNEGNLCVQNMARAAQSRTRAV